MFGFGGLCSSAVERLLDDQVANGALPLFAAVWVGDLFYTADIQRVGNTAIAAIGVGAAIAASVWPVLKFNFVAAFDDLAWLIKAGVADGSAIAAGVVAVGVIDVDLAASTCDGMGAGCACAIAVVTYIGFVGDIADGVEG